jgi:MFS superfamily sulfate permease-like transporter
MRTHDASSSTSYPPIRAAWRHDLPASVVVFLVALPLCMGIAVASGVPPEKAAAVGILTGVVGGLVVGLLGGSPLQVSGPAAGLTVLVFELVQRHGWEAVGPAVLVAGVVQLVAGALGLGQWFRAVSPTVVQGMLAGIGVLIVVSQFHVMVDDRPRGDGLANLVSIPEAVYKGVVPTEDATHHQAALVGLATIAAIVAWSTLTPKRWRVLPPPLVAVVAASALVAALGLPVKRIALPGDFLAAIEAPAAAFFARLTEASILVAGLTLAVVASAETLLCAAAVDRMHAGPRTRYDRELAAQGVGNTACGLLGALPMTGVIVRSSANVQAGARTRMSAVLHGAWLLLFVCLFPGVLEQVPMASLAAVLVFTGYKLVDWRSLPALWRRDRGEVLIYAATLGTIVATDLLTGVLTGVILSVLKLAYTFSHLTVEVEEDPARKRTVLQLGGTASFISLPKLAAALDAVPHDRELHVRLDALDFVDHACLELLMNWEKQWRAAGGTLTIDWAGVEARVGEPTRRANGERRPPPAAVPSGDGKPLRSQAPPSKTSHPERSP